MLWCMRGSIALLLVSGIAAHNWMNTPGRAVKVSMQKPCPPRQDLQQAHVQINPGGTFPVEWATGHAMSTGNWILVRAEDEARLSEWDGNVEREYFNGAHSSESFKTYHVGKQNMDRTGGCGLGSKDKTFVREVNDPYKRPDHFHGPGPGTSMYEFNPKMKKNCHSTTWAGYTNPKHPWIVAASGYTIPVGAATQGGISLFKVPPNAPSGKYVLHWYWRRYVNCLDVNVVPKSNPVTDIWGSPGETTGKLLTSRIDHCQTWRRGVRDSSPDRAEDDEPIDQRLGKELYTGEARETRERVGKQKEREFLAQINQEKKKEQELLNALREVSRQQQKIVKEFGNREYKKRLGAVKGPYDKQQKKIQGMYSKMFRAVTVPFLGKLNLQDWGVWYPRCTIVRKGENAAEKCANLCRPQPNNHRDAGVGFKCDSINIVPFKHPATSAFAGQVNKMIPDLCLTGSEDYHVSSYNQEEAKNIPDDAYICYILQEDIATDAGPAMTITEDPEDPAWYSTCLKTRPSQQRVFAEPTCGKPCILEEADGGSTGSQWRFGSRCISCELMKKNNNGSLSDASFVPEWTLAPANTCTDCDAQAQSATSGSESQCTKAGGIQRGEACCPTACGQCGGDGCSKRPGGSTSCCSGAVIEAHARRSCATHSAPCKLISSTNKNLMDQGQDDAWIENKLP